MRRYISSPQICRRWLIDEVPNGRSSDGCQTIGRDLVRVVGAWYHGCECPAGGCEVYFEIYSELGGCEVYCEGYSELGLVGAWSAFMIVVSPDESRWMGPCLERLI